MIFITLLYFISVLIIALLAAVESTENNSNGKLIPKPNAIKLAIFVKKLVITTVLANNAAINNGLHGITIAPKKKPKINALSFGFLIFGI